MNKKPFPKDAPSIKRPVKAPKAIMKDYGGTLGVAPKLVEGKTNPVNDKRA